MRFASLGSGSEGNGLLVSVAQTHLLMDCGFGLKDSLLRLARLGMSPEQLTGILVTHEHGDHSGGIAKLARKYNLPVWLTHGTRRAQPKVFADLAHCHEIDPHQAFHIGDVAIQPYPVPHDAGEPVQFVFSDGAKRLGVLTDTGCSIPHIEAMLTGCHALVLECNHDADLLENGNYPYSLKQRIGGRLGHLNNQQSAQLLAQLEVGQLQHIIAAHLSLQNNTPQLAIQALSHALNCNETWIGIADQHTGFDWREIT
ncbi:MAG: MBL fold metallo-hydrolase [Gallionella sp.]